MGLALDRDMARWYPLRDHPVQLALVAAVKMGIRFPLVPAGRRSGKTERAKRFVAKEALSSPGELYFLAAPTRDQAKRIWWRDIKALTLSSTHIRKPSESELIVFLPNGSEVHVIGLDQPARIEGVPWTGGIIDEIADVKEDAWNLHVFPALNTVNPLRPDYRAWCWLIGVPDGLNHYYQLCQKAETGVDPLWSVFHWKSSEILPPDVIESMRRVMSPQQFRQEVEASFETATGRIYSDYSPENYTTEQIDPHEQLCWMHDQNYTPLSSAIGVVRQKALYLLDEIILTSAVSSQSAEEFVDRYRGHHNKHVLIYGDPSGRNGEKHGHVSDYIAIETVLRREGWTFSRRIANSHPAIKDRQNAVRAKVCNAAGERTLFVNTEKAPYCHQGLATVQLKKGSTFQEEEGDFQHVTTAIGYMVSEVWPIDGDAIEINIKMAG